MAFVRVILASILIVVKLTAFAPGIPHRCTIYNTNEWNHKKWIFLAEQRPHRDADFIEGAVSVVREKRVEDRGIDFRGSPLMAEEVNPIDLNVYYRIYNPVKLEVGKKNNHGKDEEAGFVDSAVSKAPLIVLHGGPSLPSEYLYSIAQNIPPHRSIIFYDQIGCGQSSEPKDFNLYGIPQSIDDLEVLLCKLKIYQFHLLGHSFGGSLAYEYVKRNISEEKNTELENPVQPQCLSVILANTPTNMQQSNDEWDRLVKECASDASLSGETPYDKFFRRNQCRLDSIPDELLSAFDHCGTVWLGTDVVANWTAVPFSEVRHDVLGAGMPPFALIQGEFDFVTRKCTSAWKSILGEALTEEITMDNCSHYVHLERPETFGKVVEEFVSKYDS